MNKINTFAFIKIARQRGGGEGQGVEKYAKNPVGLGFLK